MIEIYHGSVNKTLIYKVTYILETTLPVTLSIFAATTKIFPNKPKAEADITHLRAT